MLYSFACGYKLAAALCTPALDPCSHLGLHSYVPFPTIADAEGHNCSLARLILRPTWA